jgi:hypothetical protein
MSETELATINPCSSRELSPISRPLDVALSRACNALQNGRLPATALAEGARLALLRREQDLDAALAPASPERIRKVLATISDMPSKTEEDRAKLRFALERDVADLSEFPEWALAAAARAYRKGSVGDGVWRPTVGQLAAYCRQKLATVHAERARIRAVLTAKIEPSCKPIDPERRGELAALLRSLGDKLTDHERSLGAG